MEDRGWERWGAIAGLVAAALGLFAASLEHRAPGVRAPAEEVAAHLADHRSVLLGQSLLMLLTAAALLWFLGSFRAYLLRSEGGDAHLTTVAFAAGFVGFGMQAVCHAPQSVVAMASRGEVDPHLAAMMTDLGSAIAVVAYVPLAVMMAAVAGLAFRTRALPTWLGWFSAVIAVHYLIATAGIAVDFGSLARGGWGTYVFHGMLAIWLVAVPVVMLVRTRDVMRGVSIPDTPEELLAEASTPRSRWGRRRR